MERRTSFLTETRKIPLTLDSMDAYMALFGLNDQNVALVEQECGVAVSLRGSELFLTGEAEDAGLAESVILKLLEMIRRGDLVDRTRIRYAIALAREGDVDRIDEILRAAGVSPRMIAFAHATTQAMIDTAGEVTPAFGRGEVITVNGTPVELLLVKNPMGFRLSLASFKPEGCDTMICINDEYADGRDMSWLWDVDFTSLRGTGVKAVSGVRAWDMALRLEYDQVPVESVSTDLEESVVNFVNANSGTPKHIYCTYTAMLKTRAALAKIADVADAGVGVAMANGSDATRAAADFVTASNDKDGIAIFIEEHLL